MASDPEQERLDQTRRREANWKRWGPYLSDRQWGTVREDYSADGDAWRYFPFDHAHLRTYRWGEDGLLGITDRQGRMCFAVALWNGKDPILKERLFGLSGHEGNHGEDVKELYYHLDATPTASYLAALYKYPQAEFPYAALRAVNAARSRRDPEYDPLDTGVFDGNRYFDVLVEYAKRSPEDILIRLTISNRGPEAADLHVLPTLWFRNTWSWGRTGDDYHGKPRLFRHDDAVRAEHPSLGDYEFSAEAEGDWLFTENVSDARRLWGAEPEAPYVKSAFHEAVIHGRTDATNPAGVGTKVARHVRLTLAPGESRVLRLRLRELTQGPKELFGALFDQTFAERIAEADRFWDRHTDSPKGSEEARVVRLARAGLLWTQQLYYFVPREWLEGDPSQPKPPEARKRGRNSDWANHLYNRDVISMPDKWEYPWYAAWDLAFHMIPWSRFDPEFAKGQLELFLREWYLHPNGQIPAYEWNFSDVNPPVHAWAAWRIHRIIGTKDPDNHRFLSHVFQKLLMNFTWWVNRKDEHGHNLFSGGFLGLDNIGLFDRSRPLPGGVRLEQADGTAWMAFYCTTMLGIATDLSREDPTYSDLASKFFEHFVAIADAMNTMEDRGLWDPEDGFYYDELRVDGPSVILRIRSMVGIIPLFACIVLDSENLEHMPAFQRRTRWFLANRPDMARNLTYLETGEGHHRLLLAIPTQDKLVRVLRYVLDEDEFLAPYGIRSLSKKHRDNPFALTLAGMPSAVSYLPGESDTGLFGGNSNWRGPIWFPVNWLLIESLQKYHYFYGDTLKVECPTGSGVWMNLHEVALELAKRLSSLFLPDATGRRPIHGEDPRYADDPDFKDLVLFYEYFNGDDGQGLGASHQTGWTALVAECLRLLSRPPS